MSESRTRGDDQGGLERAQVARHVQGHNRATKDEHYQGGSECKGEEFGVRVHIADLWEGEPDVGAGLAGRLLSEIRELPRDPDGD